MHKRNKNILPRPPLLFDASHVHRYHLFAYVNLCVSCCPMSPCLHSVPLFHHMCPDEGKGCSAQDLVIIEYCRAENLHSNDIKNVFLTIFLLIIIIKGLPLIWAPFHLGWSHMSVM